VNTSFRNDVVEAVAGVGIVWSVSFKMRFFSNFILRNLSSQLLAYGLIFGFFSDVDTSDAICIVEIIRKGNKKF